MNLITTYVYSMIMGLLISYIIIMFILMYKHGEINFAKYINPLKVSNIIFGEASIYRLKGVDYGIYSHIGGRSNNEDSCAVVKVESSIGGKHCLGYIAVVADGAGGHEKGEVASRITVNVVTSMLPMYVQQYLNNFIDDRKLMERIRHVMIKANEEVLRFRKRLGNTMVASTLTLAVIARNKLFVGHVGDSTAFIYDTKTNKLIKITRDHSRKGVLYKAIGATDILEPDIYRPLILRGTEIIILTSDGGVKYTGNTIDKTIFKRNNDPYILSKIIVEKAYENAIMQNRKPDNITAIVIKPSITR